MLPYYLIGIICDYLDKTKDRLNLHVTCNSYWTKYQKVRFDGCQKCHRLLDKWNKFCYICDDSYHRRCHRFRKIKGVDVCRRCSRNICHKCLKYSEYIGYTEYDSDIIKCIYCKMQVIQSCCAGYIYPDENDCICIDCQDKYRLSCQDCGHSPTPGEHHCIGIDELDCNHCGSDKWQIVLNRL